jgi:kynurenine formamidase
VFVRKAVDLSLSIDAHTQIYPGDPAVRLAQAATIDADGFNLLSVEMGSQTGTNCDAPYHFLPQGARIDEMDLTLFTGIGVVIDVRGKPDREPINVADIEPSLDDFESGAIAILHTGWPRHYGTARYFDHPYLTADACQALLDVGVRTFCLDVLNIDETPDDSHPGVGFPAHKLIAAAGGVVVENLTNIDLIDFPHPLITVFPLKLTGADGGPTRAVALDLSL